jgi:hypothetical protein
MKLVCVPAVLLACCTASGEEAPLPYQKLWKQHFWKKTPNLVLDDMELVEMSLSPAVPGIRPMTAALASVIRETCHVDALTGPVRLEQMVSRAEDLKGGALSAREQKLLARLYSKVHDDYLKRHPEIEQPGMTIDITFGIRDVRRLEKSASDCETPEEIVRRIARLHGYGLFLEHRSRASFAEVKKALDIGLPVLVRKTGAWHVVFGCRLASMVYSCPETTTLMPLSHSLRESSLRDIKSHDPRTSSWDADRPIRSLRGRRTMDLNIMQDYDTDRGRIIPNNGSIVIEPFEEGRFEAWFVHSGERSAKGLDEDILKILGTARRPEAVPPETGDFSHDFWNRHYYRKIDLVLV